MVSDDPTPAPAETPIPNVPLIHRPGEVAAGPATVCRPPLAVRKRLLVVDDEQPVLKLLVRVLSADNYDIQSADSGVAAAKLLEMPGLQGVDLLVTDLMMPQMNGRELAAVVRRKYPAVRVLYVTGFADTLFTGVQELREGESFVEKPFRAEGLLEAARLLMFGHIADGKADPDRRDSATEWPDQGLRTKVVRLLKRFRVA